MNPTLEHRGVLTLPDYSAHISDPPKPLPEETLLRFQTNANMSLRDKYLLWQDDRMYGFLDTYFAETPFNFKGMAITEYINLYASQRLDGLMPDQIKMPIKWKRNAETAISFLDRFHQPIPSEFAYWSLAHIPSEFAGKGVDSVVRPNRIVRVDIDPRSIHDYLSVGKENEAYNDGKDFVYPGGCVFAIRNSYGCATRHWDASEYILPMGSKFYVTDMYQANIPRGFEIYKDITVIEVTMLPLHKQCGKTRRNEGNQPSHI